MAGRVLLAGGFGALSFLTCQCCLGLSIREFLAREVMLVPGRASSPGTQCSKESPSVHTADCCRCCVLSNCDLGNDSELPLNPISCCAFHDFCHLLYSAAHFAVATALHMALVGTEPWCHYFLGAHLQNDGSSVLEQRSPKHPKECQGSGGSWGGQQSLSAGAAPL